jgi:hypothetical protein
MPSTQQYYNWGGQSFRIEGFELLSALCNHWRRMMRPSLLHCIIIGDLLIASPSIKAGDQPYPAVEEAAVRLAQVDVLREEPESGARPINLSVEARCDPVEPGRREAHFEWTAPRGDEFRQVVEITMFRDGFEKGTYETIATLPAGQSSVSWTGGDPGISYLWRVRTVFPNDETTTSEAARFDPPVCPVDFQREGDQAEP